MMIYTDSDGADVGILKGASGSFAYGSDENSFQATVSRDKMPQGLGVGSLVYIGGEEWGGRVTKIRSDTSSGEVTFGGPTWHGLLLRRVIMPPSDADRLQASGDANACIKAIVDACGVNGIFEVSTADSGITVDGYLYERFVDAYSGLSDMLASAGARLKVESSSPMAVLSAVPIEDYSDAQDASLVDIDASVDYGVVNKLVCAGLGEGPDRIIVTLYADRQGNVSQTQSIFGDDVVEAFYDYPNADESQLIEEGTKKLKAYQTPPSGSLTLGGGSYQVGDIVGRYDPVTGIDSVGPVSKRILRFGDSWSIECEIGEAVASSNAFGSVAESSGGVSYIEGYGIEISGNTISASVGPNELEEVSSTASQAATQAAQAHTLASAAVKDVQGTAPISATVDDETKTATVTHDASGVTAGAYGPTANLTPAWGDTVTLPPRISVNATGHITQAQGRTLKIPNATATQSSAGLMSASDKSKLDAADDTYAAHDHEHSAADITSGALPIARGGTGATAANAAEYAIIGNPPASSDAMSDSSRFAMTYATPSAANGTFITRTAAQVWAWIKGKADELYAKASHTHSYAGSASAGGPANSALKFEEPRTISIAGAVNGSAQFDGSSNVTITVTGDSEAANFLAAHPVGSIYSTTSSENPGSEYGGTWVSLPSLGGYKWERTA